MYSQYYEPISCHMSLSIPPGKRPVAQNGLKLKFSDFWVLQLGRISFWSFLVDFIMAKVRYFSLLLPRSNSLKLAVLKIILKLLQYLKIIYECDFAISTKRTSYYFLRPCEKLPQFFRYYKTGQKIWEVYSEPSQKFFTYSSILFVWLGSEHPCQYCRTCF